MCEGECHCKRVPGYQFAPKRTSVTQLCRHGEVSSSCDAAVGRLFAPKLQITEQETPQELTSDLIVWSAAVFLQAGLSLSAGSSMVPYGAAQLMESFSNGLCSVLLSD